MVRKILKIAIALEISLVLSNFVNQEENFSFGPPLTPIVKFFSNHGYNTIRINVINSSNINSMDIGNEILKELKDSKLIVNAGRKIVDNNQELKKLPVILIVETLIEFSLIESSTVLDSSKFILVILAKNISTNYSEVLLYFRKYSLFNVNFIIRAENEFFLLTFFPFSNKSCGNEFNLKIINKFHKRWLSSSFYPNKVHDLHNCRLKVGVNPSVPFTMIETDEKNETRFDGIEVEVIRILAQEYNFKVSFEGPFPIIGTIYSNGSSFGLLSLVHEKKTDIVIGTLSLQLERLKFLSGTTFYMSDASILSMPPTTTISPFEKLYMPFDLIIWSIMIVMYIFGVIIVTITRFISKSVYEFIVGKKVNHPIFNMYIVIVGTTQKILPNGTFSRFLLAKFLIFCLVMRGLYQGKLFDIMHKDIYEKEAKTINELIDRNFNFYTYESLSRRVQGFKFASKMIVIPFAEIEKYQYKTINPYFNGVVFSYEAQVMYKNYINRKNFSLITCKERLVNNQLVFYLQKNHYMAEEFSEKIEWFREFGISNHIISKYVDPSFRSMQREDAEKEALKFYELSATFGLWLCGLMLALIILIMEVFYGVKIRKHKK